MEYASISGRVKGITALVAIIFYVKLVMSFMKRMSLD